MIARTEEERRESIAATIAAISQAGEPPAGRTADRLNTMIRHHNAVVRALDTLYRDVQELSDAHDSLLARLFAQRKEQADDIHQRLDRRVYLLERQLLRLTRPIVIPPGWLGADDSPPAGDPEAER